MSKINALVVMTLVSLAFAEEQNSQDDPFTFDYHRLRVGGLILAAVLCLIGITILLSGHCRCKFNQDKRRRTGSNAQPMLTDQVNVADRLVSMEPTAPPHGWSEEKLRAGQMPPPPYQDAPYPGYPAPQPGQGYSSQPLIPGSPPQYDSAAYGQQPHFMGQPHPPQQGAVTIQPTIFVAQGPLANPVNDYMCYSIFTMLCCCLPLGIAALIYSISAREANYMGNQMAAERSSRTARTLNHVALGFGIGIFAIFIVYVAVVWSLVSRF